MSGDASWKAKTFRERRRQKFPTYNYDDRSRLTSAVNSVGTVAFTYDNRNRVKTTTDVFGHVLEYSYDPNGNRTQLKLDGNVHTTYNYNTANLLTTLTDDVSQNFGFGYDISNKLTSKALPNGITSTFDYDGSSRLTRLKHQSTAAMLVDNYFAYNPANQISQIAELAQTRNLTYDNVNRLTAMSNATANESYTFDGVGNRTASHRSATYSYQPFNRMTATATATMNYDSNGNLIGKSDATNSWVYTWDYENQMTQASNAQDSVNYRYDALGRRVERYTNVSLEDTKFTYDGLDAVMDDDVTAGITKYQNGIGIDDKLSLKNGGVSNYFLSDHLGSTVALTNSSGAITEQTNFDSFGNAATNLSTRHQYTGREYDSFSGLYYYRARWYDSNIGRFVSEDPIGFAGNDVNLFGYVKNNSASRTDPLGLFDPADWEKARLAIRHRAAFVGGGGTAAAGAFAGPAAYAAVGFAGFAAGYGIGYYPGQWTANHPSNPFVRGPLNPFGTPFNPLAGPQPRPQAAARPTCQPTLSTPWYRNPPMPFPFAGPPLGPNNPPRDPDKRERCFNQCAHLLNSPTRDLQSSEFRKCYRECIGTL